MMILGPILIILYVFIKAYIEIREYRKQIEIIEKLEKYLNEI